MLRFERLASVPDSVLLFVLYAVESRAERLVTFLRSVPRTGTVDSLFDKLALVVTLFFPSIKQKQRAYAYVYGPNVCSDAY